MKTPVILEAGESQTEPTVPRDKGGRKGWSGPLCPPAGEVGVLPTISDLPALFDSPSQYEPYEHDLAHRWWALSPGDILPLSNGDTCQILFAGRPGSATGPDVRDAVLRFTTRKKSTSPTSTGTSTSQKQGKKLTGDVEFHIRASDWYTHRHHTDPRYNNVILHVVLICDRTTPTLRQDGATIPLCSLYDLHHLDHPNYLAPFPHSQPTSLTPLWPCHTIIPLMSDSERSHLLRQAGLLRFEQKTHAFVEQLHNSQPHASFTAYDTCLIPALAEGLGYGRDRAIFRAAGLRLLGILNEIPEPLGHTPDPSPLDARRLHILHSLVDQWRNYGAWETIRKVLTQTPPPTTSPSLRRGRFIAPTADLSASRHLPEMDNSRFALLRAIFPGLSSARTDILVCNVVLPFAAAVALVENNPELAEQARDLYLAYPALPSNSITRAMYRQLQLPYEPHNACQQQGLHYIYAQTCREKHCARCIAGRHPL